MGSQDARSYHEQEVYSRTRFFFQLAFYPRPDPEFALDDFAGGDWHDPSTFTVDGRRWRCSWKRDGSTAFSDRAHWDDGWWPTFETPGVKRLFRRQPWVSLWGRDRIEEAVANGRILEASCG